MDIINQLPMEILEDIFFETLPPSPLEDRTNIYNRHPLKGKCHDPRDVIIATCTRWKTIATSSPKLWTRLQIDTEGHKDIQVIEELLNRSGVMPLDVLLDVESPTTYARKAKQRKRFETKVLDLLRNHFWRLRVFSVSIVGHYIEHDTVFVKLFPPDTRADFLKLEQFIISCSIDPEEDLLPVDGLGIIHAPNLAYFKITANLTAIWDAFTPQTMNGLKEVYFNFFEHPCLEAVEMLSTCLQLQTLCWECDWGVFPRGLPSKMVYPDLRSLTMDLQTTEQCDLINEEFYTPQLESLNIRGCHISWIKPFLNKNSQIHNLGLNMIKAEESAEDVFSRFTDLRSLRLRNSQLSHSFFATFLSISEDGRVILPHIEEFELAGSPLKPTKIGMEPVLLEVIRSRVGVTEGPIFRFSLLHVRPSEWDDLMELQRKHPYSIEINNNVQCYDKSVAEELKPANVVTIDVLEEGITDAMEFLFLESQ
ncbi:hypothetical protein M422DRAFT_31494 [Sphaerobolus stellatus SS14]|uniref:F-box domain-containing protein n=1 Tax=Sphaerobolus stellatus (strain SS14) TaxID=990650 RepID=A0A0C9VV26_SPHS4|nr:hypothetical protein M422DRAFT_31494 [Sphaerobolus stellatus SS14]